MVQGVEEKEGVNPPKKGRLKGDQSKQLSQQFWALNLCTYVDLNEFD